MKEIVNKITQKNKLQFLENVCSSRTNSELLQNLKKQGICNRGAECYD